MLAERLGMTWHELRQRMTMKELSMWMAFDSIVADDRKLASR